MLTQNENQKDSKYWDYGLESVWPVKSCPKMISPEKWKILTHLQKLPKNVGDLDRLIVATGFEKLPKVQ